MIKIYKEEDKLKIEGELNLGYIGLYKGDKLKLEETSINEYRKYGIVKENLDRSATDEEIIDYLNNYYNSLANKINENIQMINGEFLSNIFDDMYSCGKEFWNNEELIIKDKMPPNATCEKIYSMYKKTDFNSKESVEKLLRIAFPMFNFDKFFSSIVPEYAYLTENGNISFQCSDNLEYEILCGAYDVIDKDLNFTDWHNF